MISRKGILALLVITFCYAGILILGNFPSRIFAIFLLIGVGILFNEFQRHIESTESKINITILDKATPALNRLSKALAEVREIYDELAGANGH